MIAELKLTYKLDEEWKNVLPLFHDFTERLRQLFQNFENIKKNQDWKELISFTTNCQSFLANLKDSKLVQVYFDFTTSLQYQMESRGIHQGQIPQEILLKHKYATQIQEISKKIVVQEEKKRKKMEDKHQNEIVGT